MSEASDLAAAYAKDKPKKALLPVDQGWSSPSFSPSQ